MWLLLICLELWKGLTNPLQLFMEIREHGLVIEKQRIKLGGGQAAALLFPKKTVFRDDQHLLDSHRWHLMSLPTQLGVPRP